MDAENNYNMDSVLLGGGVQCEDKQIKQTEKYSYDLHNLIYKQSQNFESSTGRFLYLPNLQFWNHSY